MILVELVGDCTCSFQATAESLHIRQDVRIGDRLQHIENRNRKRSHFPRVRIGEATTQETIECTEIFDVDLCCNAVGLVRRCAYAICNLLQQPRTHASVGNNDVVDVEEVSTGWWVVEICDNWINDVVELFDEGHLQTTTHINTHSDLHSPSPDEYF